MCICKIRFLLCICVLCWKDKVMLKTQSDGKLPVIIFFSHICSQTIFCTSAAMTFFFLFFFWELQSRAKEVTMTDGKWEARCHDEREREGERERSWGKKSLRMRFGGGAAAAAAAAAGKSLFFTICAVLHFSYFSQQTHEKTEHWCVSSVRFVCMRRGMWYSRRGG